MGGHSTLMKKSPNDQVKADNYISVVLDKLTFVRSQEGEGAFPQCATGVSDQTRRLGDRKLCENLDVHSFQGLLLERCLQQV